MKYYISLTFLVLGIFVSGCYSTRTFPYQLNDQNKAIIKRVFTSGIVSCTDGYCWQINSEQNQANLYTIDGSRILFMGITLKATQNKSDAFKVKLRVTNLGLRYRKVETPFLNELEGALFDANKETIKEQISTILKEAQEKSDKKSKTNGK